MDFGTLLKGLRNLEEKALDAFLQQYSGLIRAYIQRYVRDPDAEDATQEFFYHTLKTNLFAKFAGADEAVFTAYLLRSAINFAINWGKKEFNTTKNLDAIDFENPKHRKIVGEIDALLEKMYRKDVVEKLNMAIAGLNSQQRGVFELKLLDYSNSEIAEILDAPLGSVNSWYMRGLKQLRENLKDLHTNRDEDGLLK